MCDDCLAKGFEVDGSIPITAYFDKKRLGKSHVFKEHMKEKLRSNSIKEVREVIHDWHHVTLGDVVECRICGEVKNDQSNPTKCSISEPE